MLLAYLLYIFMGSMIFLLLLEELFDSDKFILIKLSLNYICLFDYLFISSQMSAKPYFIGSTGILLLW